MTSAPPAARRRLHPLSPLLHGAKTLTVIVAAISWQGYARLGPVHWAELVGALLVLAVGIAAVSWYFTGFELVGRELRIHEGLLWRRTRSIPWERLQTVEVRRPALARLAGVAELRLEVVGGDKTEAPLAFLGVAEAHRLRDLLITLIGSAQAAPTEQPAVETPVAVVADRDVIVSQLLTPHMWSLPIALGIIGIQAYFNGSWTFIGIASTITALAGTALQPVRRILTDTRFQLRAGANGLHVSSGLIDLRQQLVPVDRVQAVHAVWPLLWRGRSWLRLSLDIAGSRSQRDNDESATNTLLPVGDLATARRIVPLVLPGVDLVALPVATAPTAARWCAPLGQPYLGVGLADSVFVCRSGVLTRQLALVPYARIQSVRVVSGPWQRLHGLATVCVDTASGTVAAVHRTTAEAWWLADQLSTRMRAARR